MQWLPPDGPCPSALKIHTDRDRRVSQATRAAADAGLWRRRPGLPTYDTHEGEFSRNDFMNFFAMTLSCYFMTR